jgi:hypothetical protein
MSEAPAGTGRLADIAGRGMLDVLGQPETILNMLSLQEVCS